MRRGGKVGLGREQKVNLLWPFDVIPFGERDRSIKGMPKNIVKALYDGFRKAIDEPSFRATLEKYEMPVMYKNTEDCAKDWAEAYLRAGEQVRKYMKKE
jgi:hypothetical protein